MEDDAPKKKKPKTKLPGARTMEHMRKEGFVCGRVEHWNSHCNIRQDLFGFADLIAMRGGAGIIAVQATSDQNGANANKRIAKILAEPRAKIWLQLGGRIMVFGWRKLSRGMVREKWVPKIIEITLKEFAPEATPESVSVDQGSRLAEGSLFNTGDEP